MRWLDEFKNDIAVLNTDSIGKHIKVSLNNKIDDMTSTFLMQEQATNIT
jgi:hypothetical protein